MIGTSEKYRKDITIVSGAYSSRFFNFKIFSWTVLAVNEWRKWRSTWTRFSRYWTRFVCLEG